MVSTFSDLISGEWEHNGLPESLECGGGRCFLCTSQRSEALSVPGGIAEVLPRVATGPAVLCSKCAASGLSC